MVSVGNGSSIGEKTAMAFFIKPIRKKAHEFILARLIPLQKEVQTAQTVAQINHQQTMQVLQAIAKHLNPELLNELPQLTTASHIATGDVVISPNYAKVLTPDDVFLASFPRSGNTWTQVMIAGIVYPPNTVNSLGDLADYIPDPNQRFTIHNRYSTPRVVKTHQPYHQREGSLNEALYGKFIYVMRHPYKVMNSYYDFERFRAPHLFTTMGAFVEQVVMGGYHFGNWGEHVLSWEYAAKKATSLFLRYEDMTKDAIGTIKTIANFLGHPVDDAKAADIKHYSSQENMIEMDKRGAEIVPGYAFVRRGEDRQTVTKETLTDDMKAMIVAYNQKQMDAWGYLADGSVADDYAMKGKTFRP